MVYLKPNQILISTTLMLALTACGTSSTEHQATRLEPAGPQRERSSEPLPAGNDSQVNQPPQSTASLEAKKSNSDRWVVADEVARLPATAPLQSAPALQSPAPLDWVAAPPPNSERENYAHFDDNPVKQVSVAPVSTFSIDVDTGSYSNLRRMLRAGQLPRQDAVRVEEMLNYFNYDYPSPKQAGVPFQVTTEIAPTPWNANTRLLQVGIQGYSVPSAQLPAANLVFLVDVSGSMQSADKLELLKSALKMLTKQLRPEDRVSLVVYAGASGVVLEPVAGDQRIKIEQALERLSAGGSTNGADGIRLAYRMAEQAFIPNGINRVLLATDGDFNVGTVNFEALIELVKNKRQTGIALTTLGFGSGNYNDQLMEQLADAGNGNYAYIDSLHEANKVLVKQVGSTLHTIAKDVKIQLEFNPAVVSEYRLIGYENRLLKREDFNNDKVDAGEIGAGHTVTALYEIALQGESGNRIDALRYGQPATTEQNARQTQELAYLRLRYKAPHSENSELLETPILRSAIQSDLANSSQRFRFAAAVAGFGQLLRGGTYLETFDYPTLLALARAARGPDPDGYRSEFLQLVSLAESLSQGSRPQTAQATSPH